MAKNTFNPFDKITIDCQLALDPTCNDAGSLLSSVASWMIAIAGTLFFIMLLVGGIQYLASGGNEEATTKAKNTLLWAIVGLIIVLSSWAALSFFLTRITGS